MITERQSYGDKNENNRVMLKGITSYKTAS